MFIYKITNIHTGDVYVGKTTRDVDQRFKEHKKNSKSGKTVLYIAMRLYGVENFTVSTLEECNDNLDEREIFWIKHLEPTYNMTEGGDGGSTTHDRMWVTNGEEDLYIFKNSLIPNGYKKGRSNCVFNNVDNQREFSRKSDRKKAGRTYSERCKAGLIIISDEERLRRSNRFAGDKNPAKRQDVKEKISKSWIGRDTTAHKKAAQRRANRKSVCEYCGKECNDLNYKRWHGDNCKNAKSIR